MSIVENEYIHEDHRTVEDCGHVYVVYEPTDFKPISVAGTIYFEGNEGCPFMGVGGPLIFTSTGRKKFPKVISSMFDVSRGIIKICWASNPGDHFLCLSYEFEESIPDEPEETQKINWREEGF